MNRINRRIGAIPAALAFASLLISTPRAEGDDRQPAPGQDAAPAESGPVSTPDQPVQPALDGYCPVSYFRAKAGPVNGSPEHAVQFQADTYFLSSEEAKKAFVENPEKYVPQFGGLCATALGGSYGNRIPSDPTVYAIHEGNLYLFSSERAKNAWVKRPEWFIGRARVLYRTPALDGYCPVSYQLVGEAIKGSPTIRQNYKGEIYHFASEQMKRAFIQNPDPFLPRYDGFCAEGVSRGKRYPGDPAVFAVIKGKTYFFFDETARAKFAANAEELIKKADADWEKRPGPKPLP